jgi:hypothetical protein
MIKKYSYLNIGSVLLTALLVIMPFHAAIVTILGNYLPYKLVIQGWKEALILVLAIICICAIYKDRKLLSLDLTNRLALAIILFSLAISILNFSELNAFLAGIKTNLVVFVLFLEAQVLASKYSFEKIFKIIMIPATIVAVLGILQPVIFKPDLLQIIGYNSSSIIGGQYIEASKESVRVFSTLGGPNQLGAYLIIPFTLGLVFAFKAKKISWYLLPIFFLVPIYMTYSRSAWIGTIVAALSVLILQLKLKTQLLVATSLVLLLVIFGYSFYSGGVCRYFSQPVAILIHGDCKAGNLGGSDMIRVNSIQQGIDTVVNNPFGKGIGSAGPASFYTQKPLIVENWYLQIAIEIGIIGLLIYAVFIVLNLKKLYITSKQKDNSVLSTTLFAAICGILVTSLFLHTLADSTLSILLFGLLGITISMKSKELVK